MNGEVLRGEVYWVCLDDSVGAEEKTGRPAVVVSANGINAKLGTVTVAFITTSGFASPTRPSIDGPNGLKRRVVCEQIRTVDKTRLDRYESTLSESELIRVTGALASALSIPLPYGGIKSAEKAKESDDTTALRCEADMWRKMYEMTMNQLVEIRVAADIAKKTESKPKPGLFESDPDYEEDEESEEGGELKGDGDPEPIKPVWDGVKVNVNTVPSATELKRRTGMSIRTASEIVRTRNAAGEYESLDDLLALDYFGAISMNRYGHMLTVDDELTEDDTPKSPQKKKKK